MNFKIMGRLIRIAENYNWVFGSKPEQLNFETLLSNYYKNFNKYKKNQEDNWISLISKMKDINNEIKEEEDEEDIKQYKKEILYVISNMLNNNNKFNTNIIDEYQNKQNIFNKNDKIFESILQLKDNISFLKDDEYQEEEEIKKNKNVNNKNFNQNIKNINDRRKNNFWDPTGKIQRFMDDFGYDYYRFDSKEVNKEEIEEKEVNKEEIEEKEVNKEESKENIDIDKQNIDYAPNIETPDNPLNVDNIDAIVYVDEENIKFIFNSDEDYEEQIKKAKSLGGVKGYQLSPYYYYKDISIWEDIIKKMREITSSKESKKNLLFYNTLFEDIINTMMKKQETKPIDVINNFITIMNSIDEENQKYRWEQERFKIEELKDLINKIDWNKYRENDMFASDKVLVWNDWESNYDIVINSPYYKKELDAEWKSVFEKIKDLYQYISKSKLSRREELIGKINQIVVLLLNNDAYNFVGKYNPISYTEDFIKQLNNLIKQVNQSQKDVNITEDIKNKYTKILEEIKRKLEGLYNELENTSDFTRLSLKIKRLIKRRS